jgi:DNA-binding NarL/FixJ family response regulator
MKLLNKNIDKYNKCLELHASGLNQKSIAENLGVTEKTITKWLKPNKEYINDLMQSKANIINRINLALKNNEPASVIKDLSYSLTVLKSIKP